MRCTLHSPDEPLERRDCYHSAGFRRDHQRSTQRYSLGRMGNDRARYFALVCKNVERIDFLEANNEAAAKDAKHIVVYEQHRAIALAD